MYNYISIVNLLFRSRNVINNRCIPHENKITALERTNDDTNVDCPGQRLILGINIVSNIFVKVNRYNQYSVNERDEQIIGKFSFDVKTLIRFQFYILAMVIDNDDF